MSWFRRGPKPPVNVRLEDPYGNTIRLSVRYIGFEHGKHVWWATTSIRVDRDAHYALRIGMLPPKTTVRYVSDPEAVVHG